MTISHTDTRLLKHLGTVAAQVDPVPGSVVELARAAWETRALDAELLELVSDARSHPAGVRAVGTAPRMLTFQGEDVVLEMQLEPTSHGQRLTGQLVPASGEGTTVRVEQPDRPAVEVELGDLGDFAVDVAADVLLRVRVSGLGRRELNTGWIDR